MRNILLSEFYFVYPKKRSKNILKFKKQLILPEDVVYGKHNFNRYKTIISFISNFLAEDTDTDEMYEMTLTIKSMT